MWEVADTHVLVTMAVESEMELAEVESDVDIGLDSDVDIVLDSGVDTAQDSDMDTGRTLMWMHELESEGLKSVLNPEVGTGVVYTVMAD